MASLYFAFLYAQLCSTSFVPMHGFGMGSFSSSFLSGEEEDVG